MKLETAHFSIEDLWLKKNYKIAVKTWSTWTTDVRFSLSNAIELIVFFEFDEECLRKVINYLFINQFDDCSHIEFILKKYNDVWHWNCKTGGNQFIVQRPWLESSVV